MQWDWMDVALDRGLIVMELDKQAGYRRGLIDSWDKGDS